MSEQHSEQHGSAPPPPQPQPPQPQLQHQPRPPVPWAQAISGSGRGTTPRQLVRRMRTEEKARKAAARRATVKLQAATAAIAALARQRALAPEPEPEPNEAELAWAEAQRHAELQAALREAEQERAERAQAERDMRAAAAAEAAAEAAALAEAAARAEEEALVESIPWGWEIQTSHSSGDRYFFNTVTGECQWTMPAEEAWGLETVPEHLAAGQCWVEVLQSASLRSGVALDSAIVGAAQPGALLFVLEFRHVPSGRGLRRARIRCYEGWLSVTMRDGSVAVQLAEPPASAPEAVGGVPEGHELRPSPRGGLPELPELPLPAALGLHGMVGGLPRGLSLGQPIPSGVTASTLAAGAGLRPPAHARNAPAASGAFIPTLYRRSMQPSCRGAGAASKSSARGRGATGAAAGAFTPPRLRRSTAPQRRQ